MSTLSKFNKLKISETLKGPLFKKKGLKPRRRTIGWKGKATNYKGLSLKCEVTFEDGTKDSVTLTTNLRKNRG